MEDLPGVDLVGPELVGSLHTRRRERGRGRGREGARVRQAAKGWAGGAALLLRAARARRRTRRRARAGGGARGGAAAAGGQRCGGGLRGGALRRRAAMWRRRGACGGRGHGRLKIGFGGRGEGGPVGPFRPRVVFFIFFAECPLGRALGKICFYFYFLKTNFAECRHFCRVLPVALGKIYSFFFIFDPIFFV